MKIAISSRALVSGRMAITGGGSISPPSSVVDTTPPSAPASLFAFSGSSYVGLTWTAIPDASFYEVYRDGSLLVTVGANSYNDTSAIPSTTYSYFVRAVDAAGNASLPTSITNGSYVRADTTPPSAPTGLSQYSVTETTIGVSWNTVLDAIQYKVYRDGILVAPNESGTVFFDSKLTPSTYYQYRVSAVDASGNESVLSAGISIATLMPVQTDKRFGVKANGTRNPLLWPYDALAPCNVPIGSGATLVACPIAFIESGTNSGSVATRLRGEREILFMNPSAPLRTIKFNCYGWGGIGGCSEPDRRFASTPATWNQANWFADFQVPCDDAFIVPSNGENNCVAFIGPDGLTVYQTQPYCHWQVGADHTSLVRFQTLSNTGQSVLGSHGGSNISALAYTILYGEITNAIANGLTYLSHGLKLNVDAHRFYYRDTVGAGYAWPAAARDGYWAEYEGDGRAKYGGTNPYCVPGALLTLQSSFNVASLSTLVGRIIAETIKRFGAILVDDTTWNMVALGVEDGPRGSVITELAGLTGGNAVSLNYDPPSLAGGNAFYQDMRTICANLYVVTNNSPTTINGGGSYLYGTPAAPTIGI